MATPTGTLRSMETPGGRRIGGLAMAAVLAACLAIPVVPANAALVATLSDFNSTALVSLDSPAGMYSWTVDGIENLQKQWFWFRIGNTGPEQSLDTLSVSYTSTANTLMAVYTGTGFSIDIFYTLLGGTPGSLTADIAETIRIRNTGSSAVNVHFFQYSDFNLNGAPGDDWVEIDGVIARQWDSSLSLSETSAIREANHAEVGTSTSILAKLNDGNADDLSDALGPLGPGDVAWAFQWDQTLGAGKSFFISKDKQLTLTELNQPVPEPATLGFLAMGSMGFALPYLRRRLFKQSKRAR